ncbi:MAG: hypothetical protein AMXMBFR13_30740 [Phycisphaerae bacterium]
MKCPRCDEAMERGSAFIEGTLLGFLLIGFSHQHLWFQGEDETRWSRHRIMPSGGTCTAFRFAACKAVLVTQGRPE